VNPVRTCLQRDEQLRSAGDIGRIRRRHAAPEARQQSAACVGAQLRPQRPVDLQSMRASISAGLTGQSPVYRPRTASAIPGISQALLTDTARPYMAEE